MKKQERLEKIISYLQVNGESKSGSIASSLGVERNMLWRDMQTLIELGKVVETKKGYYKLVDDPLLYIEQPFYQRKEAGYNFDFIRSYDPVKGFFTSTQKELLEESVSELRLKTVDYQKNKRHLENILIDTSFASSLLEGNTYSMIDTEVLIKYNEIAKEKSQEETTMILNHKKTIEYILHYKDNLEYNKKTIQEIHTLLSKGLIQPEYVGKIRSMPVEIGLSKYTPLDNEHQLLQELEVFQQTIMSIKDPFEQSLFSLVFVSYFQLFMDVNKRTSRLLANLSLAQHNLPRISFLQTSKKEYITAILAVYELNDVSLLASLYTNNYLLNMHRYTQF